MRFWDSSAIVPLALAEIGSGSVVHLAEEDPRAAVWWATPVEVEAALHRALRDHRIDAMAYRRATATCDTFQDKAIEVAPSDEVRREAVRLVRLHELRTADALQLAAALTWCAGRPEGEAFVSLDRRLRAAADLEGFSVLPVDLPPAG